MAAGAERKCCFITVISSQSPPSQCTLGNPDRSFYWLKRPRIQIIKLKSEKWKQNWIVSAAKDPVYSSRSAAPLCFCLGVRWAFKLTWTELNRTESINIRRLKQPTQLRPAQRLLTINKSCSPICSLGRVVFCTEQKLILKLQPRWQYDNTDQLEMRLFHMFVFITATKKSGFTLI